MEMQMSRILAGMTVVGMLAAVPAHADWKGKGELGFVLSRGNSEAQTLNAKVDTGTEVGNWTHTVGFSALRATTANQTTANRYELRGQTNYKLTDRSYVFGALRYEDDRFSAFDYQATASAGYGYKFIDTPKTKLSAQIGAGYRVTELRLTGQKENGAVARGDVAFEHQLTDTTKVIEKFLVESGSSNTFLQNELSIQVRMTDALALSVAHAVRHNTEVPAGLRRTDQLTTANLVFAF
jgi:putative salt-induced outer membrane protein